MQRKVFAFAIVLLIAGLAPASAIIGFCTRMPCCKHASATPLAFSVDANDCCTTITCFDSPSAKLTSGASTIDVISIAPVIARVVVVAPLRPIVEYQIETSPPIATRHRLAILSTLLI